jgi:flagellar basal body-associated protein FliL
MMMIQRTIKNLVIMNEFVIILLIIYVVLFLLALAIYRELKDGWLR